MPTIDELRAAYERAERCDRAEQVFRSIVAAEPDHAAALNYLGYMLAERGERARSCGAGS